MLKILKFMYIKTFDNAEWDPGEIDIFVGIYSLQYQRKLNMKLILDEEVIVYAVHAKM